MTIQPKNVQQIVEQIDSLDPAGYAKTRNHLDGKVTHLSPYISRGVISLPFIRDRLLQKHSPADCEKLIQELAWREYFQNVWWAKQDAIFSDLRFSRDDWKHEELVKRVIDADTGVVVLDQSIRDLYATGYMHNHARMWVASVACNLARAQWFTMARWMFYHLRDGDLASNFLSWQWVAGTSVNKRYTVNQSLINACSTTVQNESILSFNRDSMIDIPIPEILIESEKSSLKMNYPEVTLHTLDQHRSTFLYTPWTLDAQWLSEEEGERVLVFDPEWFDRFPVSDSVTSFIISQAKMVIPSIKIYVGNPTTLLSDSAATGYAIRHQTNTSWNVQFTEPEKLFPTVTGYHQSFFAYWKEVTASQTR